jgi:hypothetical protein
VQNTISESNHDGSCEWILSEIELLDALKSFQISEQFCNALCILNQVVLKGKRGQLFYFRQQISLLDDVFLREDFFDNFKLVCS